MCNPFETPPDLACWDSVPNLGLWKEVAPAGGGLLGWLSKMIEAGDTGSGLV